MIKSFFIVVAWLDPDLIRGLIGGGGRGGVD